MFSDSRTTPAVFHPLPFFLFFLIFSLSAQKKKFSTSTYGGCLPFCVSALPFRFVFFFYFLAFFLSVVGRVVLPRDGFIGGLHQRMGPSDRPPRRGTSLRHDSLKSNATKREKKGPNKKKNKNKNKKSQSPFPCFHGFYLVLPGLTGFDWV